MAIRLALADDHPVVLDGLEQFFKGEPDFEIVARCANGAEAVDAVRTLHPDVLVLDIAMPGLDGLGVLSRLKTARGPTKIVVLTANMDDDQLVDALRLGAMGIVFKDAAPSLLVDCIRAVQRGERYMQTPAVARAMERLLSSPTGKSASAGGVTPREKEIIRLVAQGKRNEEIATRLGTTEATVKIHLVHIYQKLGVRNRVELTRHAYENGWA